MVLQVWLDVETCHKVAALLETYARLLVKRGSCENGGSTEMESKEKLEKTGEEKQMGTARRILRPICLKYLDDLICFD